MHVIKILWLNSLSAHWPSLTFCGRAIYTMLCMYIHVHSMCIVPHACSFSMLHAEKLALKRSGIQYTWGLGYDTIIELSANITVATSGGSLDYAESYVHL